jgi:hypothetical protein
LDKFTVIQFQQVKPLHPSGCSNFDTERNLHLNCWLSVLQVAGLWVVLSLGLGLGALKFAIKALFIWRLSRRKACCSN